MTDLERALVHVLMEESHTGRWCCSPCLASLVGSRLETEEVLLAVARLGLIPGFARSVGRCERCGNRTRALVRYVSGGAAAGASSRRPAPPLSRPTAPNTGG